MSDDEMKLIAEAHGWFDDSYGGYHYKYEDENADSVMAFRKPKSSEWVLSDGGAFRILVESLESVEKIGEIRKWFANTERLQSAYRRGAYADTPHEAIAQAELARLRGAE